MPVKISQNDLLLRLIKDVNDIRANLRRMLGTINLPLFDINNENTPTVLSADQNNYAPGNYDVLRLSSSQSVSITGLSGGIKGRKLTIYNDGDYSITFMHASLSSTAANRFRFSSGFDAALPPEANISFYYDDSNQRWIDADRTASGPVFAFATTGLDNQVITANVFTEINLTNTIYDPYSSVDLTDNEFTIKFSGVYMVEFSLFVNGPDMADVYCLTQVRKNTVELRSNVEYMQFVNGDNMSKNLYFIDYLEEGDVLDFYIEHSNTAPPGEVNVSYVVAAITKVN